MKEIWKGIMGLLSIYVGLIFLLTSRFPEVKFLWILLPLVGLTLFISDYKKIKANASHRQTIVLIALAITFMIVVQLIKIFYNA